MNKMFDIATLKKKVYGVDSRILRANINIYAGVAIRLISVFINILLVRILIDAISKTDYGLWLTIISITTWISLFDFGLGNGLRNKLTASLSCNDYLKAKQYISTAYVIIFVIFFMIWLVFNFFNMFIDWGDIINIKENVHHEYNKLMMVIVSFFCIQMVLKNINIVVSADQKNAISNLIEMLGQFSVLVVVILVKNKYQVTLLGLGIINGLLPALVYLIFSIYLYSNIYKKIMPSILCFKKEYVRDIMGLGLKFFIIQLSLLITMQTTNIIIAKYIGLDDVVQYNIARQYYFIVSVFYVIVLTPFWSAFTDAYIKKDYFWMRKTVKILEKKWLYNILILTVMLLVSEFVFSIWLGDQVFVKKELSILLSIYVLAYTGSNLYMFMINGIGKINLQLFLYVMFAIIYLPITIFYANLYGLAGLITINIVIHVILAIISRVQLYKIINKTSTGLWNK